MQIYIGKHKGKSVEQIVLRHPNYIEWLLNESPSGELRKIQQHALVLLQHFDGKTMVRKCQGSDCNRQATRMASYKRSASLSLWCRHCHPYQTGASANTLDIVESYDDVLAVTQGSTRTRVITALAEAKGQTGRLNSAKWVSFWV
jgi:hypothetical protein